MTTMARLPSTRLAFRRSAAPFFAAAILVAALAATASAQPTVEYALGLSPFQKNVDFDKVSAEDAKNCSIKMEKEGGVNAWVVRGPRGEVLRSFADTNGDRVVDRWSYYKDGAEVYRDIDSNHNAKADQARWLNAGGSRWGVDEDENGTLDAWKSLSAEEATAELVEALRSRDPAVLARLLPGKADLEAAGFAEPRLSELAGRVAAAQKSFPVVAAAAQKQLGAAVRWNNMLAPQPGVLPAGADGVAKDVVAYDNVVALVDAEGGKGGQVYVGSLVRVGDTWRPIDLPQVPGAQGELADSVGFFSPRIADRGVSELGGQESEKLKPILATLREIEGKLSASSAQSRPGLLAEQANLLGQVVAAAEAAEQPFWVKQLAETVAAGVQEGALPDGIDRLERLATAVAADDSLAAFVAFRLASARYAANMQQSGADIGKVQSAWLDELKQFVEKYPKAPDAAEAMLQMGIADEFSGDEKQALARYTAIVADFPESPSAKKARGAARRLESVGKPLALSGTAIDGKPVAIESLRGRPVLVHYWATWCEPCKVDIAQIRELYAKYGPKKFAVVGIALDSNKAELTKFLTAKPIPWPQLHESGGLDGRLAEELGVLTLPTMILIDADGKVVDRNLVITDLEKKLDSLLGAK
ncbi:MAG: redoxin family protein [Planctomycetia bacterium]|jgi:thiol-disulfide isomerase/thioredoxin